MRALVRTISHDLKSDVNPDGFMAKAKVMGANALLGQFTTTNGFDRVLKDLKIDKVNASTMS